MKTAERLLNFKDDLRQIYEMTKENMLLGAKNIAKNSVTLRSFRKMF